eukprot:2076030-Pleurochrysis_carterae.AAC.2
MFEAAKAEVAAVRDENLRLNQYRSPFSSAYLRRQCTSVLPLTNVSRCARTGNCNSQGASGRGGHHATVARLKRIISQRHVQRAFLDSTTSTYCFDGET